MKETATTEWEAKKAVAKRLFDQQIRENFRFGYAAMSEEKKVLDIAASSPMPFEVRAEVLAQKLEALVRKRVDKIPIHEVELMDSIICLLRGIRGEHGDFITRLVSGYERQIEYWMGYAKSRGVALRLMGDTSSTDLVIAHLIESYGRKG